MDPETKQFYEVANQHAELAWVRYRQKIANNPTIVAYEDMFEEVFKAAFIAGFAESFLRRVGP